MTYKCVYGSNLKPTGISFLFILLEASFHALVVSKELCIKAGHVVAVAWTSSGSILSLRWCLINLPTEVYYGNWDGDSLIYVCSKMAFEFIFYKSFNGWLSGQVDEETKGTSASGSAVYVTSPAKHAGPPHPLSEALLTIIWPWKFRRLQDFLGILSGRDISFRYICIRHEVLVCEVTDLLQVNIKSMDWEL